MRRVYPEYVTPEGNSYTLKGGRKKVKAGSELMMSVYKFVGHEHITILAYNFNLQTGGKIPADVCAKVERIINPDTGHANMTKSETSVDYHEGIWDEEPHVGHDWEPYCVTHLTIDFDAGTRYYYYSKRPG